MEDEGGIALLLRTTSAWAAHASSTAVIAASLLLKLTRTTGNGKIPPRCSVWLVTLLETKSPTLISSSLSMTGGPLHFLSLSIFFFSYREITKMFLKIQQ